ncbi:MAG TPA: hypothetical protein VMP41_04595 [Acidimicrobiales bacterium]|nr:hypothetical protein [Acidimicrobiales bacterium]
MQRARTSWRHVVSGVLAIGLLPLLGSMALNGGGSAGAAVSAGRTGGAAQQIVVGGTGNTGSGGSPSTCQLGNGVKHVVEITFDNVHFFRDNPNVPSDLEMMPHLLNFIEQNGTMLSNNHTPLIAHTADDILTTLTGLYGDRQGMPVANDYQAYNKDGTTDPASSFAYWTDPVYDTASTPNPGHDTNPNMVYSASPPATTNPKPAPGTTTPAPWVPFTRAGCNVGGVATANIELENNTVDIPKVFGATSPEAQQLAADPDSFKDAETADYVGVAVHCARGNSFCSSAQAVKYPFTGAPQPSATTDALPDEPGGYHGYQGLFGHLYVAPQLGAGTASLTRNGYEVTNAAGNLVDLNGNQINGAFLGNTPGFPGFGGINASQSLAYVADMQESGVPVTYDYIADIHGNEHISALSACKGAPSALGSGSPCYVAQAQYYDNAFESFFQRLQADGITPANTEFVFSSDEGDHEAGANVGRAVQPSPANCDGVTVPCTYPAGSFGELDGNLTGLLATEKNDTTPLSMEDDTAPELYVTGNPSPASSEVRTLDHDVAGLTASNPYSGNPNEKIVNYLADPAEEAILHMVNADPARTPTLAAFAKPDYYLFDGGASCSGPCVSVNNGFAWDHGDYAAEIDTNWAGFAGPGVKNLGLDGSAASAGPSSAGANSGQVTVPGSGTTGTWADETDIRPTLMYLTGLRDDYEHDGRVVSEILQSPNTALSAPGVSVLGACYKQLNSSVGVFGTDTLMASTAGIESTSPGDHTYTQSERTLVLLDQLRDAVAGGVKLSLDAAAFANAPVFHVGLQEAFCNSLLQTAGELAAGG